MSYKDLEHQQELLARHLSMAKQCQEYHKWEDAEVHIRISEVLLDGLKRAEPTYEAESLNNLARALTK